jgi:hypothetical protein
VYSQSPESGISEAWCFTLASEVCRGVDPSLCYSTDPDRFSIAVNVDTGLPVSFAKGIFCDQFFAKPTRSGAYSAHE